MKVGIDTRPAVRSPAGIGYYVKGLLKGLESINTDIKYVLYTNGSLDIQSSKFSVKNMGSTFLWHVRVLLDIFKNGVDVYHSTHSFLIPIVLGKRSVLTIHDLSSVKFPESHSLKVRIFGKIFLRLAVKRAGGVIVPSESTRDDLLKLTSVDYSKVRVVQEAVFGLGEGWEDKGSYILFIGTLEPRKNLKTLVEAYEVLINEYGRKEDLYIAGKKGWLYEDLFNLVSERDLEGKVNFLGYVSHERKAELLQNASVFVYPSLYEGFGLPVLEAMKVGVPVVCSSSSSLPEVASNAALLVDPNDPRQLAEKIGEVLENDALADMLSTKGKKRAGEFSWERSARITLEEYINASH